MFILLNAFEFVEILCYNLGFKFADFKGKSMFQKVLCAFVSCVFCVNIAFAKSATDNENNASKSQASDLLEFKRQTKHLSAKSQSIKAQNKQRVKIPTH